MKLRAFPFLIFICFWTACVSTAKPDYVKANGASNGWDVKLQSQSMADPSAPVSYEVSYKYQSRLTGPLGSGVPRGTLEIYAFYRCAELALELGKPFFIIKSPPTGILDPAQDFQPETLDYGKGLFETLHIIHFIAPFKTRQEAESNLKRYQYQRVFDAKAVVEKYKPWIH